MDFPLETITLELTSSCNGRCVHCYLAELRDSKQHLNTDTILKTIKDVSSSGCYEVIITGGEPFLHPDIFNIISAARRKRFKVILLTNGSLLNEKAINKFTRLGAISIQITLHSHIAKEHDEFFGIPGLFENVIKATKMALASGVINVTWVMNVMKPNYTYLKGLIALSEEIGVNLKTGFKLHATRTGNKNPQKLQLNEDEWLSIYSDEDFKSKDYRKVRERLLKEFHHRNKNVVEAIKKRKGVLCGVGLTSISVLHNGDIVPCAIWHTRVLGNIYKDKISDVWQNHPFLKMLRNLEAADFPKCHACEYHLLCHKCIANNELETGDYHVPPDEYCKLVKTVQKAAGIHENATYDEIVNEC